MSGPVLTARDISVTLARRPVLAGVDFALHAGRITVLIGPNGSGKTTLLRTLLGQVAFNGDVAWFGRTLRSWPKRELSRTVAYLPQAPTAEPGDRVSDVLRLGRSPYGEFLGLDRVEDDAVLASVAAELSLTDLLDRPVDTLSGGQRQRVFLGRALAQRPKALLLDEPATYLDLRHQVDLYASLARLARDHELAVLMASHDVNLSLVHADDAVVMKAGRVLAHGGVRDTLTDSTLSDAFDVRVRGVTDGERTVFVV